MDMYKIEGTFKKERDGKFLFEGKLSILAQGVKLHPLYVNKDEKLLSEELFEYWGNDPEKGSPYRYKKIFIEGSSFYEVKQEVNKLLEEVSTTLFRVVEGNLK